MPDWPGALGGNSVVPIGSDTSTSRGTGVTAAGSANTKGAWAQLSAATPVDADGFTVTLTRPAGGVVDRLADIGVGGAGAEIVLVENILGGGGGNGAAGADLFVPIPIKAGTRVAARCQSTAASALMDVSARLHAGGFFSSLRLGRATTYGANTADSGGVSLAWGGSAHTKGSWVEIASAITNPCHVLAICLGVQNAVISAGVDALLDIGIGGAGSEIAIVENLVIHANINNDYFAPAIYSPLPLSIKAGVRLAARMQSSVNRNFDVAVIGFD